ncbi:MAG: cell envelope integrity protein TolA [Gammaproteobacteria bacterium]
MLYRPILYSILIHAAVAGLLLFSFEFPARTIETPQPERNIVNAVAVDEEKVQQELDRIKEQEEQERRADEQRRQELKQIEQQRQNEEKRLAELKEQQKKETREREAEQQRLAELRKEQQELKEKQKREAEEERKRLEEERRRAEEEKKRIEEEKRRAEAEKKRIEEERRQAEAEKQRLEEEKRKAEEERKRREAEEAMKKQLAEEQRRQEEAQARADQRVINEYGLRIREAIRRQFNTSGLPEGLSCVLQIRTIPGGDVVEVRVVSSSGNSIFDRRAETAVNKASPLPVPDNMRVFEKMREIRLTFDPER